MTIRNAIVAVVLGLCIVAGVSWAQNRKERSPIKLPGEGHYAVVATSGESAIMVESTHGTTWKLFRSADGRGMWLPIDRINSHDDADEWMRQRAEQQKEDSRQRVEQQKEETLKRAEQQREETLKRAEQQEEELRKRAEQQKEALRLLREQDKKKNLE